MTRTQATEPNNLQAPTPLRVAVVTGGASGIGLTTTHQLSADGYKVATIDLTRAPDSDLALVADVTDPNAVKQAVRRVVSVFGRIDVLVNNAGITGSAEATVCHETPIEQWDLVQAVNLRGLFLCTREVLPTMLAQGTGHVITLASVAGMIAVPGRCAYTASKGGALQFSRSVAVDYAAHGIRANAVCPGFVETPMTHWRLEDPDLRAKVEANIPMGRVAEPHEIAAAIGALASDRFAYMTGQALVIDGGWTAW